MDKNYSFKIKKYAKISGKNLMDFKDNGGIIGCEEISENDFDRIMKELLNSLHRQNVKKDNKGLWFTDSRGEDYFITEKFINNVILKMQNLIFDKIMENFDEDMLSIIEFTDMAELFYSKYFEGTKIRNNTINWISKLKEHVGTSQLREVYKESIKDITQAYIRYCENKRIYTNKAYIIQLYAECGLIDFEYLIKSKFYDLFEINDLLNIYSRNNMEGVRITDIISIRRYFSKISNAQINLTKLKDTDRKKYRVQKAQLHRLINIPDFFEYNVFLYINGDFIDDNDVKNLFTNKTRILGIDRHLFVDFLNTEAGQKLNFSSKELVDLYGKKLSGNQCIILAEKGMIKPEDLILIKTRKSVEFVDENMAVETDNLVDFYTAEVLLGLYNEKILTTNFVNIFNKLLDEIPEEKRDTLMQEIILETTELSKNSDNVLLDYYKLKLIPIEKLKNIFSKDTIENFIIEEKLNSNEIIEFAKSGLIPVNDIYEYLTIDELVDGVILGKVEEDALIFVPQDKLEQTLSGRYIDDNLETKLVMGMYLRHDKVSIDFINDIFEIKKPEENLTLYINQDSEKEKIRDLFSNYHISYEDLLVLRDSGILSVNEFEEYEKSINKTKFYEELEKMKSVRVSSTTDEERKREVTTISRSTKEKIEKTDFDLEKEAFQVLFDVPDFVQDRDKMPIIESINTDTGVPTSLDGYIIIPVEKYNLVIFEKFKSQNSLFIMPYQQADYFLHGNLDQLDDSDNNGKNKETLSKMKSVMCKRHSKNFFKNVIDSATQLSEEANQELKPNGRYTEDAKAYIKYMQESYVENSKLVEGR